MRFRRRGAAGFLLLAMAGCGIDPAPPGGVGSPAPAYTGVTLEGEDLALTDLRGEVVLLNIWATWCPPCRKEMPDLQALHDRHRDDGLRVVGVSVDASGSDRAVRQFLADYGITFLILRDPSERVSNAFQAYGVPLTVLIDREGTIRWRHSGPITADDPALQRVLGETLNLDRT